MSTITIADTEVPAGFNAPYAVKTFVYPDGKILYHLEWTEGWRFDQIPPPSPPPSLLTQYSRGRHKSFPSGTAFEISNVDLEVDCLEVKLVGKNADSGRLKIMLGAGWQTRLTNSIVLGSLKKFLTFPSAPADEKTEAPPSGSSNVEQSSTPASPAAIFDSRPPGIVAIPGRLSEGDARSVLSDLQQQKLKADNDVRQAATTFSQAFRVYEAAWGRERGNRVVQEIDQLRADLGSDFIPHTAEDVVSIGKVYSRCLFLAKMRGPILAETGLDPTAILGAAFDKVAQISTARDAIIHVEQVLDAGQLTSAQQAYQQLIIQGQYKQPPGSQSNEGDEGTTKNPSVTNAQYLAPYLLKTSALRADLDAFVAAQKIADSKAPNVMELLRRTATEEFALSQAKGKPITTAYLQPHTEQDKAQLRPQLQFIPAYRIPRESTTNSIRGQTSHLSEAEAGVRLTKIRDSLQAATLLRDVTKDQETLEDIKRWYGEEFYKELVAKADDIVDAEGAAESLEAQIESNRNAQRVELVRKQAVIDQRAALAGDIVNKVLIITQLDERFNLTEIMGYSMEAQKQRVQLRDLVNGNRAALSGTLWADVRARFQQVLPGLTVWQASHAQALLSQTQR